MTRTAVLAINFLNAFTSRSQINYGYLEITELIFLVTMG